MRLANLMPGAVRIAHQRQHAGKFEAHARDIRLFVEQLAKCDRRILIALLIGQHHAQAETRLGPNLRRRILRKGA